MKYSLHRTGDGRWAHTWVRQSSIKTADMCLERLRTEIYDLAPRVETDATAFGTTCHSVAEDALRAKMLGVVEPLSALQGAFEYYWEQMEPTVDRWHKYSPEDMVPMGHERIAMWHEEIYPQVIPVAVEEDYNKILFEDHERVVYMRGTIDLVEEDCLWDWKFPSRDYAKNRWEYERWDVQSIAYCWAKGIPNFKFGIVHPQGVSYIELERDAGDTEWLRQKVLALCQLVEKSHTGGPWPLGDNGWWCSEKWCPNWARCKGATEGGAGYGF